MAEEGLAMQARQQALEPAAWLPLPTCACALGLRYSGNSPRSDGTKQLNPAPCYGENALIEAPEQSFCLLLQEAPPASICKLISVRAPGEGPRIPAAALGPREGDGHCMLISRPLCTSQPPAAPPPRPDLAYVHQGGRRFP